MKTLGLLEITPEEVYYLPEVPDLIGSETPDAKRKRQKKKEATISDDVPTNGGKNPENSAIPPAPTNWGNLIMFISQMKRLKI